MHFIDLTEHTYGRLTVLMRKDKTSQGQWRWLCRCVCGNITVVCRTNLRNGNTQSCGCLNTENRVKHGKAKSRVYHTWYGMLQRCTNPQSISYTYYGKRGVAVCRRWYSFEKFYEDMGDPPKGYTLNRINNDGDYTPENCKWSNTEEQHNNTRLSHKITWAGETMTLAQWSRRLLVSKETIRARLARGWTIEQALFTQPSKKNRLDRPKTLILETVQFPPNARHKATVAEDPAFRFRQKERPETKDVL